MRAARAVPIVALSMLAVACFSSNPPAPPVRLFDPTPAIERAGGEPRELRLERVTAAESVRAEFALRPGARELVLDGDHRWHSEPAYIVDTALQRALYIDGPCRSAGPAVQVHVEQFEFDLTKGVLARVQLRVTAASGAVLTCSGTADAKEREPGAMAEAMAQALGTAVHAAREFLLRGP